MAFVLNLDFGFMLPGQNLASSSSQVLAVGFQAPSYLFSKTLPLLFQSSLCWESIFPAHSFTLQSHWAFPFRRISQVEFMAYRYFAISIWYRLCPQKTYAAILCTRLFGFVGFASYFEDQALLWVGRFAWEYGHDRRMKCHFWRRGSCTWVPFRRYAWLAFWLSVSIPRFRLRTLLLTS